MSEAIRGFPVVLGEAATVAGERTAEGPKAGWRAPEHHAPLRLDMAFATNEELAAGLDRDLAHLSLRCPRPLPIGTRLEISLTTPLCRTALQLAAVVEKRDANRVVLALTLGPGERAALKAVVASTLTLGDQVRRFLHADSARAAAVRLSPFSVVRLALHDDVWADALAERLARAGVLALPDMPESEAPEALVADPRCFATAARLHPSVPVVLVAKNPVELTNSGGARRFVVTVPAPATAERTTQVVVEVLRQVARRRTMPRAA